MIVRLKLFLKKLSAVDGFRREVNPSDIRREGVKEVETNVINALTD